MRSTGMLDTFKELIANQYDATLRTLKACIDRCPEAAWDARVGNWTFCQVAFHTLFFTDLYLGQNIDSFHRQPFHRDNEHIFRDYEELKDRPPTLRYDNTWIKAYMTHCRNKASEVIVAETANTLKAQSGFEWLAFPRAEVHIHNIRHIQHHAAQLSLRLRIDGHADIPWIKSGVLPGTR